MVVVEVGGEDAVEVALVQDHDVVQTLAPDAPDHPFNVG
jgi:hypothetical protein